jgi:hypothetical protein
MSTAILPTSVVYSWNTQTVEVVQLLLLWGFLLSQVWTIRISASSSYLSFPDAVIDFLGLFLNPGGGRGLG